MNKNIKEAWYHSIALPASLIGALLSITIFIAYILGLDYKATSVVIGILASVIGALLAYLFSYIVPKRHSPRVFLSYVENNQDDAMRLIKYLKKENFIVQTAESSVLVGDKIIDKINDAISMSDFLIVVISKASSESPWIKKELEFAKDNSIRILPVLIDDTNIPQELTDIKFADLRKEPLEGTKMLIRSLLEMSRKETVSEKK
jgi:hypothetical protein